MKLLDPPQGIRQRLNWEKPEKPECMHEVKLRPVVEMVPLTKARLMPSGCSALPVKTKIRVIGYRCPECNARALKGKRK